MPSEATKLIQALIQEAEEFICETPTCRHCDMLRRLSVELRRTQRRADRLQTEMSLRILPTEFTVETPREFRKHGQNAAFLAGVTTAWRGRPRDNPYAFERPQYRAWDAGFAAGASAFCKAFNEAIAEEKGAASVR